MELFYTETPQFIVYGGLSTAVLLATGILYVNDRLIYQRFLGRINPLLVAGLVILLGAMLLTYLLSQGWFAIYQPQNASGLWIATGLASLFAMGMILADTQIVLPENINIPFPQSLLFYPSIAFVVEILFHVLPLTLLLFAVTLMFEKLTLGVVIWPVILLVAFLEPVYQTLFGSSTGYSTWSVGFIALHIFLINVCQLLIFKRYDFVSMYTFRLVYYLFWHVIWGYMRLRVLF